ncbi:lysophospholipase [Roseateles sp.]|uniref:alpha/beta hydrolase n=1 Tax=Roseateles sp. TaxID=1971397 RepID=UPI003956DDD6
MPEPLITHDGLRLYVRDWVAPIPRGRVMLVHGLGEHVGRYAHVAAVLNALGWTVRAYDQRGHGRSEGSRGVIASADALLRDLGAALADFDGTGPLVLLGHSMGGAVAARYVAERLQAQPAAWAQPVDALALSSPALAATLSTGQQWLLKLSVPLAPNLGVSNGLKPEWICRDPQVVQAYCNDPHVHDRISPRLTRFILDAGEAVRAAAPRWQVPTLLMWAARDRCVDARGSEAFAAQAPAGVVTAKAWPGLAHEIFNEPEQRAVLATLTEWLDQRVFSATR